MYIGETIMAGANVLSPWFPRQDDNAVFTWEEVQKTGNASLTVTIWHKNREDIGPGTEITTAWTTLETNFRYIQVDALKELIRFEFAVTGAVAAGTVFVENLAEQTNLDMTSVNWVIYRMLEPTWFSTADTV